LVAILSIVSVLILQSIRRLVVVLEADDDDDDDEGGGERKTAERKSRLKSMIRGVFDSYVWEILVSLLM